MDQDYSVLWKAAGLFKEGGDESGGLGVVL